MSKNEAPQFRAAELAALLARHYPDAPAHLVAEVVAAMQAAARGAKRFAEDRCNFDMGEAREAKRQRMQDRRAGDICRRMRNTRLLDSPANEGGEFFAERADPATIELGGDPRGPCARLHIPGQRGDGWGDGFAIY